MYEYSSKQWLSYATPILSFGRSKNGLPISCFAAGTQVMTENGLVPIEDIKVGDKVLSHDGTFNEVEATADKESNDIWELTFEDEVFHVTGDHLVMTQERGWVRVDELVLDRDYILRIKD